MPNPHNSPVLRGGRGFEKGQHILGIDAPVQRAGSEGDHRSGCDGSANSGSNHGSQLHQSLLICRASAMLNAQYQKTRGEHVLFLTSDSPRVSTATPSTLDASLDGVPIKKFPQPQNKYAPNVE
jgi:hypothetical protein